MTVFSLNLRSNVDGVELKHLTHDLLQHELGYTIIALSPRLRQPIVSPRDPL